MIFEQRIDIYNNKKKVIIHLLLSILLMMLGIWTITRPGSLLLYGLVRVGHLPAGIIVLVIFTLCSYVFIRKLMRKLPVLVIDEKGIYDYTARPSGIGIPWASIYDAEIRQKLVVLSLYDAAAFIEQLPPGYRKKMARMNYKSIGAPAIINASVRTMPPKELVRLLKDSIESQNKMV